ncbi:unnamed protein product [Mytilus coruscus]|uniref:Uncharacterized protein n=1 Tax=Mytilus coruscus TaxID=42192 RepID=A0A6J8CU39_MYTCO|nr:unnamed protein product [Mytilus coruscus]
MENIAEPGIKPNSSDSKGHEISANANESFETALIIELLRERSRPPRLVLSIIGDSSSFVPKPWLIPVLKTGLIATAKGAKDYLILYEGSKERISSIVGEAIDDLWNLREDEKADNSLEDKKADNSLEDKKADNSLEDKKEDNSLEDKKEDNLPADKKEDNKFKVNLKSIQKLKLALCKKTIFAKFHAQTLKIIAEQEIQFMELEENKDLIWRLPVLTVVAEGDLVTIDAIVQVLEINLPILLMKGSGKAADFVAGFIEQYRNGASDSSKCIQEYIKENSAILFGIVSPKDKSLDELEARLSRIYELKCLITILDVNTETKPTNFTDSVTTSIIRGWSHMSRDTWSNGKRCKSPEKSKSKERAEAIIADRHEYVTVLLEGDKVQVGFNQVSEIYQKTLLQNGMATAKTDFQGVFKWASKRAVHTLKKAYKLKEVEEHLKRIDLSETSLKQARQSDNMSDKKIQDTINVILDKIVNKNPDNIKLWKDEPEIIKDCEILKTFVNCSIDKNCINEISGFVSGIRPSRMCIIAGRNICQSLLEYPKRITQIDWQKNCPYEDLLIWAILENRPNLASIFWMKSQNQLLCALLASCLYSKMAYKVKSTKDQSRYDDMIKQARIYEERSVYLQSKLYEENAELTMELVVTEFSVWDITISPLQCAHENMMLDFISQSCCQRRLNKIWYNDIGGSFIGVLKAFFFVALVCYSAFLLTELDFIDGIQSVEMYEWIVYIHLLGDVLEQYRHVVLKEPKFPTDLTEITESKCHLRHSWLCRVKNYLYNFWNILDVTSYILTVTAIFIRFFRPTTTNNLTRRFYSLSLFTMYMRFLHIILVEQKLGPKIIMIKEMVKELLRFIGILLVFMMGVGVLYHANMYPKHKDMWNAAGWTYWRIWKIMYIPYWQIYGFNFLDSFDGNFLFQLMELNY